MVTNNFINKRILFLSVKTFNYEKAIADKLKSLGAIVDYYDERPANSILVKGIIRFKRSLYKKKINSYYKEILEKTIGTNYDSLFVIKGEVVPSFFLEEFKTRNPKCVFIFYTWDSFSNNPNAVSILKYFDRKFTFDSNDSLMFNLNFRPLFFIDDYAKNNKTNNDVIKYNLLFLGTAHSDRYKISNAVVNWCDDQKLSSYAYYYMPSRLVYIFKMLFDCSFYSVEYKKLSFKSLSVNEIISLYNEAAVILDINHPGQKGLTMRTFEALGAGKKIITTNAYIKKYPFYNENNVFVIDRENIVLHKNFFDSPYIEIDSKLYEDMSISGWLQTIFEDVKTNYWILKD
jgi:hypothetical protein